MNKDKIKEQAVATLDCVLHVGKKILRHIRYVVKKGGEKVCDYINYKLIEEPTIREAKERIVKRNHNVSASYESYAVFLFRLLRERPVGVFCPAQPLDLMTKNIYRRDSTINSDYFDFIVYPTENFNKDKLLNWLRKRYYVNYPSTTKIEIFRYGDGYILRFVKPIPMYGVMLIFSCEDETIRVKNHAGEEIKSYGMGDKFSVLIKGVFQEVQLRKGIDDDFPCMRLGRFKNSYIPGTKLIIQIYKNIHIL